MSINRHGAFAGHVCLPEKNLHLVPDDVPDEVAVFTEPLAAALEILEQVSLDASTQVLVLGAGRLGQLIARALHTTGCRLTVSTRDGGKRQRLERLGIGTLGADEAPAATFDVVVECTGQPEGFHAARRAVRPAGTIVLKSTYARPQTLDVSALVVDEITLVGSRCGPFAPALAMLADGTVPVHDLVSARYPLREGVAAFAAAGQPGVLKVLLTPSA